MKYATCLQKLRKMITKCLEEAEKLRAKSIAFPAVGTGALGYPPEKLGNLFFETCAEFARLNPYGIIESIKLVIYSANAPTKRVRV